MKLGTSYSILMLNKGMFFSEEMYTHFNMYLNFKTTSCRISGGPTKMASYGKTGLLRNQGG